MLKLTLYYRSRTDFEMTKLVRLDNAALEALAQPKPNASSKYNFYVKLGKIISGMDSKLIIIRWIRTGSQTC